VNTDNTEQLFNVDYTVPIMRSCLTMKLHTELKDR